MRERERDAEQGDRVTVLRTAALMILKLENRLESLEDRIAIHMNRFLCTSLVFSSSSLKQRSMASPPLLCVPRGGVYRGLKDDISVCIELSAPQLCRYCLCSNSNITH